MEAESGSEGWERLKFEDALSLALKTEEGAVSQGMGEASRNWKRPGGQLSPRTFWRKAALPTL